MCLTKRCANCHQLKSRLYFSRTQWSSGSTSLLCQLCDRKRCAVCNTQKGHQEFVQRIWDLPDGDVKLVCTSCVRVTTKRGQWTCCSKQCRKQLPRESFSIAISKHGAHVSGHSKRCDECIQRQEHLERATSSFLVAKMLRLT